MKKTRTLNTVVFISGICLIPLGTLGARKFRPPHSIVTTTRSASRTLLSSYSEELNDKIGRARACRDAKLEESLLKQFNSLNPSLYILTDRQLASLYEKEGRTSEELEVLSASFVHDASMLSSADTDPAILTHWGDLAFRFNRMPIAMRAFEQALGASSDKSMVALRDHDLSSIREAAHWAAAPVNEHQGELAKALTDYQIAMPLVEQSADAHLRYGRLLFRMGMKAKSKIEFKRAESLVSSSDMEKSIHRERIADGLIDVRNTVVVAPDGTATYSSKELPDSP